MISCTDAVRKLWDYLEGDIGENERHAIEEHLDVCKRCCGEAEFADELRRFLVSNAYDELPAPARDRLASFLEEL